MQLSITPDIVLLFAVLAQAVFAAGLLWFAPYNQLPNRLLALCCYQQPSFRRLAATGQHQY